MAKPKPYQQATIEAAFSALKSRTGRPRFLVADEVGLGKTIVAQHVIKEMSKLPRYKKDGLNVFYVCNNLAIASQNKEKLMAEIPIDKWKDSPADRLSMLPFSSQIKKDDGIRVRLFTLTPDTSLPERPGRPRKPRGGRKEERALLYQLFDSCWPGLLNSDDFQQNVGNENWDLALDDAAEKFRKLRNSKNFGLVEFKKLFSKKFRHELDLKEREHLFPKLEVIMETDPLNVMSHLRASMISTVMEMPQFKPGLVIFDEFQQYRDLVQTTDKMFERKKEEEKGGGKNKEERERERLESLLKKTRLVRRLRGDMPIDGENNSGFSKIPLLLLSATPYKLIQKKEDESVFGGHHEELFDLLTFLHGDGEAGRSFSSKIKDKFEAFGKAVSAVSIEEPDLLAIDSIKNDIEVSMKSVMSRTERASDSIIPKETPLAVEVKTQAKDWKVFSDFSSRVTKHKSAAIPCWRSIPLPMQTMGTDEYKIWGSATEGNVASLPKTIFFSRDKYESVKKFDWPHPKLRAIVDEVSPASLVLPWVPPSLPWWRLGADWDEQKAQDGKVLMFSRFRATPKAVAAAVSHESRVYAMQGRKKLPETGRALPLKKDRMPVLAAFYPFVWLALACDPVHAGIGHNSSKSQVQVGMKAQLRNHFKNLGIRVHRKKGNNRKTWRLLANLELQHYDSYGIRPLEVVASSIKGFLDGNSLPVCEISESELNSIAKFAMCAPGTVLARSLIRHFGLDKVLKYEEQVSDLCINGLRLYFDNPVFVAHLSNKKGTYLEALEAAVIDGNLESVFDEYIWMLTSGSHKDLHGVLDEIKNVFGTRGGRVVFHEFDNKKISSFHSHCDVAIPLAQEIESEALDGKPLRADSVRRAFNSPFWPKVVTTTSIGQEGLDFHPWCKKLIHWDLPNNAVDLEQREGRIRRYAGLSVRRSMGRMHGEDLLKEVSVRIDVESNMAVSPWVALADHVESLNESDGMGLKPWWFYPGGDDVQCLFFHLPASEEKWALERLKEQRAIYRLALGQQNQEDFVRIVQTKHSPDMLKKLAEKTPNLSAWKHTSY